MAEDEEDHHQEEDGGVVPVPGAALAVVDCGEHADVEEEKEGERDQAKKNQPEEEQSQKHERLIVLSEIDGKQSNKSSIRRINV